MADMGRKIYIVRMSGVSMMYRVLPNDKTVTIDLDVLKSHHVLITSSEVILNFILATMFGML